MPRLEIQGDCAIVIFILIFFNVDRSIGTGNSVDEAYLNTDYVKSVFMHKFVVVLAAEILHFLILEMSCASLSVCFLLFMEKREDMDLDLETLLVTEKLCLLSKLNSKLGFELLLLFPLNDALVILFKILCNIMIFFCSFSILFLLHSFCFSECLC